MAPAVTRLICRFPNCNKVLKNKSGLTQHTNTKHRTPRTQQDLNRTAPLAGPGFIPPRSRSPTPEPGFHENFHQDAAGEQEDGGFEPEEGTWVDTGHLFRTFHPHLTAKFEMAEFLFTHNQMSAKQIDTLLDLWAATLIKHNDAPPFANHKDMYASIDATPLGDTPWKSFTTCYNGVRPEQDVPPWMDGQYDVWYRDPLQMVRSMLANSDFDGGIEFSPYRDYTAEDKRYWKNFMSADWAWNQADVIAQNEENHGSTFVPLIIGSDKTVVSVATGQTEYHPLYLSIGNIHNTTKEHNDDIKYRNFRRQLFQHSLAKIFESVKPFMDTFDNTHTELLVEQLTYKQAWYEYGIIADVVPFTNDFPRADIHELLSPDILHQIIKGTFKDHLVDWVGDYLQLTHGARHAAEIMDDIDRRIAAVAPFAGLRRFPDGRGFRQWTGDDSKTLMKVCWTAIEGHVPQDVVCTFSAFLEFCYIVRCEALTEDDLVKLQDALDRFHKYWEIFEATGVVSTFSLPRQHSLCHYILLIRLFGAPNGLCSSITESKHIKAVKEPWRRSSRFNALGQMLLTNQRLDKLAAARADFEARGMLHGSCLSNALGELRRCCVRNVHTLSLELDLPRLPLLIQEFIHDQYYSEDPNPPEFDPATAQVFLGKVTIFNSAAASFYAPSDLSGTGGMCCEHIRATPSWCAGQPRHDCIFVNMGADFDSPMGGLAVAQTSHYPCAIVHWYSHVLEGRDPDTGMYVVTPTTTGNDVPDISIIHVDCIFHAAHLIPVYGPDFIPKISPHDSYDMFNSYYVNRYADHHAFEIT
ncbi:hypothetical protein BDR05DRAFT_977829 [Suillus weaverae]|nr:hypothetical protein BDR05DRAFT_977829 [Suillus weaverae]